MNFQKKALFSGITFLLMTLVVFGLGEALTRLFYENLSNYNLEMWRYTKDIKMPLTSPELPFHHHPSKAGNYYGVQIKTNAYGFRDEELEIEKQDSSSKRIYFIGDSFTLGWGVSYDSTFTRLIEKDLGTERFEVINSGIGNYNSVMEVELFKEKGLPLNPDIAVLMYFINDVEAVPKRSSLEYTLISKSYFMAFLFDRFQKVKLLLKKDYNWKSYYSNLYLEENPALGKNKNALEDLIQICKTKNIQLLFVNIPELHELENYPFPFATDFVRNIATTHEVPFLDLQPALQTDQPSFLWVSYEDAHANEYANAIIAKAIHEKLRQLGYVK